jgi:universal stress protein family protein
MGTVSVTITDADGVQVLQWCLPRLGLRWPGFRKVRRQVYKRVHRRVQELGLSSVAEYRSYVEGHPYVGRAAQTIVDMAQEIGAELVVMGTHGRTGLVHMLLGSVTEQVVRLAQCSVLTVRPGTFRFELP